MIAVERIRSDQSDKARCEADARAEKLHRRWHHLCERYLPLESTDSIWRHNRRSLPDEPAQGWKLHLSASVLEACDLFERVAPFLEAEGAHYKAPNSLDELSKINCGLQYGYRQVGKFITVYPASAAKAVELAERLHELTAEFFPIKVPFDEQFLPHSSVFYRYGGFASIEATGADGETFQAIENLAGELVPDDRFKAVPDWVSNPFPQNGRNGQTSFAATPLGTTYRVFEAISQRGKGGTYKAIDFSGGAPRLCVVKEGRLNGELFWNGQDGYFLVKNEFENLTALREKYDGVPRVYDSFELYGNFYFVMEYVDGESLFEIMQPRRRRFSIKQVLVFAIGIARILERMHRAGWVWNDCKPANLIVAADGTLRPIDFEGAYRIDEEEKVAWRTKGFSKPDAESRKTPGAAADLYALGAVIYYLLTGRFFDAENPLAIGKLRRGVPPKLARLTAGLLADSFTGAAQAIDEFEKLFEEI